MFVVTIKLKRLIFGTVLTFLALGLIIAAIGTFFRNPAITGMSPVYSGYTVVIDPGHGGLDGGAAGSSGVVEKGINLAIGQKLRLLTLLFGIPGTMTRDSDISLGYQQDVTIRRNKATDLSARLEIVRSIQNPVFVSIHLNKFGKSQYKGAQTFYSINHPAGKLLAEHIQARLVTALDPGNKRLAKAADAGIYLMKHLDCPAIIVECGFLSNKEEEALLQQDEYQKKIACAILSGYLNFLNGRESVPDSG